MILSILIDQKFIEVCSKFIRPSKYILIVDIYITELQLDKMELLLQQP